MSATNSPTNAEGAAQISLLTHKIGALEDVNSIVFLHNKYGYYIDKTLYRETVELFTDDCEVRFHGATYKTKDGARRLYIERFQKRFTGGKNGPVRGFLLEHLQLQPVVTVAPDRLSARGRFRTLMQAGRHESSLPKAAPAHHGGTPSQWWEGGIYENHYARASVNDPWKIHILDYHPLWHAKYEEGWEKTDPNFVPWSTKTYPEDPNGPDELHEKKWIWPETDVVPYHYSHPITGKEVSKEDMAAPVYIRE